MNSFFDDNNFKVEECLSDSFQLQGNVLQFFQPPNDEQLFNETDSVVSDEPSSVFELDRSVSRRDTVLTDANLQLRSPAKMAYKQMHNSVMFQQPEFQQPQPQPEPGFQQYSYMQMFPQSLSQLPQQVPVAQQQQQQQQWNEDSAVPDLFQPSVRSQPLSEHAITKTQNARTTASQPTKTDGFTKFCCHVCQKKFKRPSSLKTHMNIHTGDRPYPCPFKDCNKSFNAKSNMLRHYKLHFKLSKDVYMLPTGEISLEKPTARQLFQSSKNNDKPLKVQKKRKSSSNTNQSQSSDDYLSEIEVSGSATPLNNNIFAKPYIDVELQSCAPPTRTEDIF